MTVRNGTYHGECLVHCNEDVSVDADRVSYSLTSNVPDTANPDIHAEGPTPPGAWEAIERALDLAAVRSLPDTIGIPDAADEGGEFLEVTAGDATKRIDFSRDADVPEVGALLAAMRDLRARLAGEHRR
jgi:hypothetical protein